MSNHIYGGAASNLYGSRSATEGYIPTEASLFGTSRYLNADLLPSSSSFLYNPESYSTRIGALSGTTLSRSYGPPGVDVSSAVVPGDSLYAGLKRPPAESLYSQTLLGAHSKIGQNEAWYSTNPLAKRPRYETTSHLPIYPQRLGEKDCAYYMQTRTCRFGESCKFDHPIWVPEGGIPDWKEVPNVPSESLPERPGEEDCPYFLKTQRCKFGIRCKFNHPKDRIVPPGAPENGDTLALPERPSEPPCAFYMKTGNCKFGITCKFHHPKDVQIQVQPIEVVNDNVLQSGILGDKTLQPPLVPALMHNSKGLPIRLGEEDCPFYLKTGSCKYGATCRYSHPERYVMNPPAAAIAPTLLTSPSARFSLGNVAPTASFLPNFDSRISQASIGLSPTVFPQRPGQQECDYYMKTGICKFGNNCKFHHPIDRSAAAPNAPATDSLHEKVILTLAGLPRREGAIHCPYYMKTGTCKYGATCRFDHPPPGEVMAGSTSAPGEGKENGNAQTDLVPQQQQS